MRIQAGCAAARITRRPPRRVCRALPLRWRQAQMRSSVYRQPDSPHCSLHSGPPPPPPPQRAPPTQRSATRAFHPADLLIVFAPAITFVASTTTFRSTPPHCRRLPCRPARRRSASSITSHCRRLPLVVCNAAPDAAATFAALPHLPSPIIRRDARRFAHAATQLLITAATRRSIIHAALIRFAKRRR